MYGCIVSGLSDQGKPSHVISFTSMDTDEIGQEVWDVYHP